MEDILVFRLSLEPYCSFTQGVVRTALDASLFLQFAICAIHSVVNMPHYMFYALQVVHWQQMCHRYACAWRKLKTRGQ